MPVPVSQCHWQLEDASWPLPGARFPSSRAGIVRLRRGVREGWMNDWLPATYSTETG